MKKLAFRLSLFVICLCFDNFAATAGEIFPPGKFDWSADQCEVKDKVKDGKYSCGMFLDKAKDEKRQFIFWYQDHIANAGEWTPRISLDKETVLRDAKASVKVDFSQIDASKLHRMAFLLAPSVILAKGKTYEATVYIRSATPDMKISLALMGNYKKAGRKKTHGLYRFSRFTTSTMWRPFTVRLSMDYRQDAAEAVMKTLAVQADSPGVFWIGRVSIVEKGKSE
jgi:hypothetical protein